MSDCSIVAKEETKLITSTPSVYYAHIKFAFGGFVFVHESVSVGRSVVEWQSVYCTHSQLCTIFCFSSGEPDSLPFSFAKFREDMMTWDLGSVTALNHCAVIITTENVTLDSTVAFNTTLNIRHTTIP